MASVLSREAAACFLMTCRPSTRPVVGWDKRTKAWVPVESPEEIMAYLEQYPKHDEYLGISH